MLITRRGQPVVPMDIIKMVPRGQQERGILARQGGRELAIRLTSGGTA